MYSKFSMTLFLVLCLTMNMQFLNYNKAEAAYGYHDIVIEEFGKPVNLSDDSGQIWTLVGLRILQENDFWPSIQRQMTNIAKSQNLNNAAEIIENTREGLFFSIANPAGGHNIEGYLLFYRGTWYACYTLPYTPPYFKLDIVQNSLYLKMIDIFRKWQEHLKNAEEKRKLEEKENERITLSRQYPLSKIGVYRFLNNAGYLSLYNDNYRQFKGANLYSYYLKQVPLAQEGKDNLHLYVLPNTGEIFQISLFFSVPFNSMSAVDLVSKFMSAIEESNYSSSDKYYVEMCLSKVFDSIDPNEEAEYFSSTMNRYYGFKKYMSRENIMELRIKSAPSR